MRRVRWLGIIFTVVQFWLYMPPAGVAVPFDQLRTGLALAVVIAAINIALLLAERALPTEKHGRLALFGLLCDASFVFGLVWLFRFDTTSALWGLLVIPVLEAAVAAQLAGALIMWATLAVGYIVREIDTAARYDYAIFELPSITFRMGIVLIVAATAGSLARSLTLEARAQRAARLESQQRARLLHGLALSSQALLETQTQTDAHAVWNAIVAAAIDVGFDGASILVTDAGRDSYIVASGRGLPEGYVGSIHPLDAGIAGLVWERGEAVELANYSLSSSATTTLKAQGFGACIAVPIRREYEVEAVLVAAHREPGSLPRPERECIELLAIHAGVALNNVAHSAERARFQKRLTEIAYTDKLTGLPNRDLFLQRLQPLLSAPCGSGVAVLFVDVDRFKTVNDSLGHHGGDALLVELATRLVAAATPHLVARHGGDEFTVLADGVDSADEARCLAERLMAAISGPVYVDGQEILPSVSIGVRFAQPGDGSTADVLLRDADTAMYRAKKLGRQRAEVFDPAHTQATPSLTVEAEMRRGMERGEFTLHYQPVVSMVDGRVRSVEALLRWSHPRRGMVRPMDFIPVAEDSGFIVQLGRWVLHAACAQAAEWRAAGVELDVAVNVSVVQLQHAGLIDEIKSALAAPNLSPSRLVLEITESATVTDPDLMLAQTRRIRALGVRLALDDFGQGTTSLRFVRRLPLDVLKIDKSFVDDLLLERDAGDPSAVVRSVVQLAHDLGLTVIAEGVEEQGQMAILNRLGCDQAQGYLLGRPLPAAEIAAVVQAAHILGEVSA